MKIFYTTLTLAAIIFGDAHAQQLRPGDWGKHIKTITTPIHFIAFDNKYPDRCLVRDESSGMTTKVIMLVPGTDSFLANHAKDDLRMTYDIYDRNDSGKTVRLNYITRIVSLKTGDDANTWYEKEAKDTELAMHDKEFLNRLRGE